MKKFLLYFSALHGIFYLSFRTIDMLNNNWQGYYILPLRLQLWAMIFSYGISVWLLYGLVWNWFHLNRDNIIRVVGIICNIAYANLFFYYMMQG